MPIFEYLCEDCGTHFEKLVRREGDEVLCPGCSSQHLNQQLSTFSAHANGRPQAAPAMGGGCPAGMCRTPGMCGRN